MVHCSCGEPYNFGTASDVIMLNINNQETRSSIHSSRRKMCARKKKIIALISQSDFSSMCLIVALQYNVHFAIICCHGYW